MIIELNNNLDLIPEETEKLAIGFFDGVHKGHMLLFKDDVSKTSVLTFTNLPNKENYLYDLKERIKQLKKIGTKNVFIYDVSQNNMSGDEFINTILKRINPKEILIGEDFKFGNDLKSADYLCNHFNVKIIERNTDYSSSKIKSLLLSKKLEEANKILMWPYYRRGEVIKRAQKGREIGFKTANIKIDPKLLSLPFGSYVTETALDEEYYQSVTYIGESETIGDKTADIETHLINVEKEDFYKENVKINFYKWLAPSKKFRTVSNLIYKIDLLIEEAKNYFKNK